MDLHDCDVSGVQVVGLRLLRVEDLDGERSAGDAEYGRVAEVPELA